MFICVWGRSRTDKLVSLGRHCKEALPLLKFVAPASRCPSSHQHRGCRSASLPQAPARPVHQSQGRPRKRSGAATDRVRQTSPCVTCQGSTGSDFYRSDLSQPQRRARVWPIRAYTSRPSSARLFLNSGLARTGLESFFFRPPDYSAIYYASDAPGGSQESDLFAAVVPPDSNSVRPDPPVW